MKTERIREICNGATPGPWVVDWTDMGGVMPDLLHLSHEPTEADAVFIQMARDVLPARTEALERALRNALDLLDLALEGASGTEVDRARDLLAALLGTL